MSFPEARVLPESQELSFHDIHHCFMKMFPRQLIGVGQKRMVEVV